MDGREHELAVRLALRHPNETLTDLLWSAMGESDVRALLEAGLPGIPVALACGSSAIGDKARLVLRERLDWVVHHPRARDADDRESRCRLWRVRSGKTERTRAFKLLARAEREQALEAIPWVVDHLGSRHPALREGARRTFKRLAGLDAPPVDRPALIGLGLGPS